MTTSMRWTSADLAALPDNGKRYEIIDGELYVSKQPHSNHQLVCANVCIALGVWNKAAKLGQVYFAPGLIFADDDDVAPDLVWVSHTRRATALSADGKFHSAPELVIEVLSPGSANERRDREAKLRLYSRRGVHEYWIMDWRTRSVEVYRREQAQLRLFATLYGADTLDTSLLPGFACPVVELFEGVEETYETPEK